MKNLSTYRTTLAGCAIALAAFLPSASVFAQQPKTVHVTIPFAFQDGTKAMPAGTYEISMPSERLMLLRSADYRHAEFSSSTPDYRPRTSDVSKVVFHRYGSHYFLHEVVISGQSTGYECIKTKAEKQLQVAENPAAPTGTEVALNVLPQ